MFPNLFSPVKIGNLELPNRLVVAPMVTCFSGMDGKVNEQYIEYVREKSRGGWGLIINEAHSVYKPGTAFDAMFGLWEDDQIEGQKKLVEAAHAEGQLICVQLIHGGRQSLYTAAPMKAPSPIADPTSEFTPEELTIDEIHTIIEAFGDAALRAKKAGYDAVEIHGAHGYLILEFTSPYSNKRTDEYGGSLEGRAKFSLDIIRNIRSKVGPDFPIIYRMSTDEYLPHGEGITIADSLALAMMYEEAGVNAIHSSIGNYTNIHYMLPPSAVRHGESGHLAAELKKVVNIPVINVGRYIAEASIKAGRCDIISMGRQSLADPDFPKKAKAGQLSDIRHCLGCQLGCITNLYKIIPIRCCVNPRLGYEHEYVKPFETTPKKVIVVGGGVGGCYAAIAAAEHGHDVSLYEKADRLGGQWNLACVPPYKQELATLVNWQRKRMTDLGVKIHLNRPMDAEKILALEPDEVILATGGVPIVPRFKGIDGPNVTNASDVISGKKVVGPCSAVIGGGEVGSECAAFIGSTRKQAVIFEMQDDILEKTESSVKLFLNEYLQDKGIEIITDAKVLEIKNNSIVYEKEGETKEYGGFSDIVIAIGTKAYNPLETALKGKINVHVVGDAVEARQGIDAVREGYRAGFYL